jgi:hypothetical protein
MNETEQILLLKDIKDNLEKIIIGEISIWSRMNYINGHPDYIISIRNKNFIPTKDNNFIFNYDIHKYYFFKEQNVDKIIEDIIQQYKKDIYKLFFFEGV